MSALNTFIATSLNRSLSFLSALIISNISFGQPPNDNCANAINITTVGGPCINGTAFLATSETFEAGTGAAGLGCWATPPDNTVWYRFTPGNTANYTFGTTTAGDDTQLKILTGTCGAFSNVACNEDWGGATNGLAAQASAILNAGSTYYIQVDFFDLAGAFCLSLDSASVTTPPVPVGGNDCVFGAIDLTPQINLIDPINNPFDCYTFPYSSAANPATRDNVNGNSVLCDPGNDFRDVWYKFTVTPTTPNIWIDVYSATDYVSALYSGTPTGTCGNPGTINGLTYIDCSDGSTQGGPRDVGAGTTPAYPRINCNSLAPGTYYYRVWEYNGGAPPPGDMNICIESGVPIGVTRDSCPSSPTIGKTCGIPNTNVDEIYYKLSNAGTTGNANNTNLNEPQVAVSASGEFQDNCVAPWNTTLVYANNVINNTAIYRFDVNTSGACQARTLIEFQNMEYGGVAGASVQIQVMNNVCAGGASAVMTATTTSPCLSMRPALNAGLSNGPYYIVVDGQNGQLVQYDLRLRITHNGAGCTASTGQPAQPFGVGASRCGSGAVTLTASGCTGGTLKWYAAPIGGASIATGTSFTTPTLNTSTAYYVSCTQGTCESARTLVYATINQNPLVIVPDTSICLGSNVTILTQVNASGGTYLWSPGGQTTSSISVNPNSTTNYIVEYTRNGCVGKDTATVTVNVLPTVSSTSTTICNGGSGTITATGSPLGGTYLWMPTSTATDSLTESPTATTNYNVTYSRNGCSASAISAITVNPVPTATLSGGGTICAGATAQITVNFIGNGPFNVTYTNGTTSTTVNNILANPYTFNTNIAGTYSITAFSNSNCAGTFSGTANVTVRTAITTSNLVATCGAGNANYTVSFQINGGDPASYSVTGMGGGTITGAGPYIYTSNPIAAGTTNYSFTVNDAANCSPVTVSGIRNCNCPTSAVISGGGTICQGSSSTVTITITLSGTAPFNFTYSNGTTNFPITNYGTTTYSFTTSTAGNYTMVSVSDANACGGSVSGSATVTQTPQPAYTVNQPTICSGQPTPITVTPAVSGGTYLWTAPATVVGQTSQTVNVSPTANTKYYVTYTLNGCSRNDSSLVTVNPTPTVSVPNQTICEGNTATITATGSPAGAGSSYVWNSPSSVAGQTTATVTDAPGSTQIYSVTYTLNGCSAQGSGTVTVSPTPIVSISPVNPTICSGDPITLSANSTATGGTYNWTPAGLPSTSSITVNPTATTTYSVTHTIGTCVSNSSSTTVTVNPKPTAIGSSNSPVCENGTLNLTSNTLPTANYTWSGPGGFVSGVPNPTINNVQTNQAGAYTLVVTQNGCSSTPSTVNVLVNAIPDATITPAGPLCINATPVNLSAATPGGNWTGNGITNGTNGTFNPSVATAGTHTITYSLAGACPTSSTEDIVVNDLPVINFSATPTDACAPSTVQFTSTVTPAPTSVLWTFGDGGSSSATGPQSHLYLTSGSYTVSLMATANGCSSTLTQSNYININPIPVANFNANPNGTTVDFKNTSVGANTYEWTFGNGQTSTQTDPSTTFASGAAAPLVQLVAFNAFGCSDTIQKTINIEEEVVFYVPNAFTPNGDVLNQYFMPVMTSGFDTRSYSMQIFNRWGQLIFETKDHLIGWDGTFNNTLVPDGLYTWSLKFTDINTDRKYKYEGNVNVVK